jgi:cyclopropane fatty-acyl-phospholipid synthase-like methyltransferase
MGNKKALKFYDKLSQSFIQPTDLRNKSIDTTALDVEFLKKYIKKDTSLLDIGSGTGLIVNSLKNDVKKIIAIEIYKEFSELIHQDIDVIQESILTINLEKFSFSIVTIFGTMHYFNEVEAKKIYKKIYDALPDKGILIVKNQFGIEKDIKVTYSKELESEYFAEYRYINKEMINLEKIGFTLIEKVDIYPKHYNRWDNTHFYALVLKKDILKHD